MIFKTSEEIEIMREGGKRLASVLESLRGEVRKGMTTDDLDKKSFELIRLFGAEPAFLNYRPTGARRAYPKTLCASVNDEVVHGVPSDRILRDGDILSLDLGLIYKKFYLDAAITVIVGNGTSEAKKLLKITKEALEKGISAARAGNTLGDIGHAIQSHVEGNGFSVAKLLTGHGIGRALHEDPAVLNTGRPGDGEEIVPGMVLAIEPMVVAGNGKVKQTKDDVFITADNSLAAHFEHTIAITKKGPEILTQASR